MNRPLYWTGIALLFFLVAMIIWETVAITTGKVATISLFAEELNNSSPLVSHAVTMLFGMLIGHWFIPPSPKKEKK